MAKRLNKYSTATDAAGGVDLIGKTAVVTGGNSGIGTETVRALAAAGAKVIMTSRNEAAGETVAKALTKDSLKGSIVVKQLDLADLHSVQRLSDDLQNEPRIDFLVLNAGVMFAPHSSTKDGFEMHWGTNHVGHFALASALLPKMKAQETHSRVVVLSSLAHTWQKGPIVLDDINFSKRKYSAHAAYGQSKLANLLHVKQLAKELEGSTVEAFAVHPGVVSTPLFRRSGFFSTLLGLVSKISFLGVKSPPQGAATSVYAALSPDLQGRSGLYLADCAEEEPSKEACDMKLAAEVWKVTESQIAKAMLR